MENQDITINLTSVDNYDPTRNQVINSPRSLEAMRILGIIHEQIASYPQPEYLDEYPDEQDQKMLVEHFSDKRDVFLGDIRTKREQIIKFGGDEFGIL